MNSRFTGFHARIDGMPLDRSSRGMQSLRQVLRALRHGELSRELWAELGNVVGDLDGIALAAYHRLVPRPEVRGLAFFSEQAPNPDSRVTLAAETDALGLRKVRLDWRLSDLDRTNLQRSLELLGAELGGAGLGRVRIEYRDEDIVGSYHHMGTTRMHTDPKQGVVDANCRVHGMDNLYIAAGRCSQPAARTPPRLPHRGLDAATRRTSAEDSVMSGSPNLSRRRFIVLLALLPGLGAARAAMPRAMEAERMLSAVFTNWRSAAIVGRVYLQEHPEEAEVETLLARLDAAHLPPAERAPLIERRIRADFLAGRVVSTDGWILARTEARLCALAALL